MNNGDVLESNASCVVFRADYSSFANKFEIFENNDKYSEITFHVASC